MVIKFLQAGIKEYELVHSSVILDTNNCVAKIKYKQIFEAEKKLTLLMMMKKKTETIRVKPSNYHVTQYTTTRRQ